MREIGRTRALLNVAFAALVLGGMVWGASQVARRHWLGGQKVFFARADFARIGGLAVGDTVRLQGMEAGIVDRIDPPGRPGGPIHVTLRIDQNLRHLIRSDAVATISIQNAVGPKSVEIMPGRPDAPFLADDGKLETEDPVELGDLLATGQGALKRLDALIAESNTGVKDVNAIIASINRGEGTLGQLVRSDAAYLQLLSLARQGEKTMAGFDDSMGALKGMWPIAGYFKDRGYDDPDRVLYRPNATREVRVLPSSELFQPDSAILTDAGRRHLDALAAWFKETRRPDAAEVVIAAFVAGAKDEAAARVLTQDQARAVQSYLADTHKLFDLALFKKRAVAAVGFGTKRPKPDPDASAQPSAAPAPPPPADRVEFVVFTPRS